MVHCLHLASVLIIPLALLRHFLCEQNITVYMTEKARFELLNAIIQLSRPHAFMPLRTLAPVKLKWKSTSN